jgi:predicted MPP superfamily phosphohydrolase
MMVIILFVVFILEAVMILAHILIYKSIILMLGISAPGIILVLKAVFALGSISFLGSTLIASRWHNRITRVIYLVASVWLAIMYVLLVASAVGMLCLYLFNFDLSQKLILGISLYSLAVIAVIYAFAKPILIKVKEIELKFPNLPEHWQNKKIVFISDLHFGPVYNVPFSKKISTIIQNLHLEALLIGGDLFDGTEVNTGGVLVPLSNIKTVYGTYFITGNHEEFDGNANKFIEAIDSAGFKILHNKTVDLNGLTLAGVDYYETRKAEDLKKVLLSLNLDLSKPSILLKHVPSNLNIVADAGFDAVLSGHTHNGQIYPFGFFAKLSYGYSYGLHLLKKTQIYVSSGLGTWGPPARLASNSEIVLITLKEK